MARTGRPTKLTPALEEKIINMLSAGVPFNHAVKVCGIDYDTAYGWFRRGQGKIKDRKATGVYLDFARNVEAATSRAVAGYVGVNSQVAKGGAVIRAKTITTTKPNGDVVTIEEKQISPPSGQAAQWALERMDPDNFAPRQPDISVMLGIQIKNEEARSFEALPEDPRRKLVTGVVLEKKPLTEGQVPPSGGIKEDVEASRLSPVPRQLPLGDF